MARAAKKKTTKKAPARKRSVPKEWPAAKVETRAVARLVPYARNARTHTPGQVKKIAASIREWGWTNPVLVDEKNTIIAGHGRVLAAELEGIETVPVMVARGWSDAQRRAYVIADNRLALDAGWDKELLGAEIGELTALDFDIGLTGFGTVELSQMFGGTTEDELEDLGEPEKPHTLEGDLWILGEHRILCGDSTERACMERLLDGEEPRLMVTDPPYGVQYSPRWRIDVGISRTASIGEVKNDNRVDWTAVWNLFAGEACYVWHAGRFCGEVSANLREAGFDIRAQIIWRKGQFVFGRGNYHWQHEPCFYAVRHGSKAHWVGDRSQSTVWDVNIPRDGDTSHHGTQKPVEIMAHPMRNHDAPVILDPFLGSGSTLVAAHQLGRKCLGLELDPGYVDVAIRRWQRHSGEQAVRESDGVLFDALVADRED